MAKKNIAYWRRWIEEIAVVTPKEEIVEHIRRHATEDLERDLKDGTTEDWVASMYNLLAIFQQMQFGKICGPDEIPAHMIDLLRKKWHESPKTTVPPPLDPRSW